VRPRRTLELLVRAAPITVPSLVVVVVLGALVLDDVGYPITTWAPATLLVLGLLGVAAATIPNTWGDVPVAVRVAAAGLIGFTAWTFLSLLWTPDRGAGLEGAGRTLLYCAVFLLFALWRQRGETAALVVATWTAILLALATVWMLRVGAGPPGALDLFIDDRLRSPAGYPNAAAATWLMALWPAVALAAAPRMPWQVRGLFAGGAVVVLPLALLSVSRGSLFAVPLTALLFLVLLPDRVRHLGVLLLVGVAATPALVAALDVGDALQVTGGDPAGEMTRVAVLALAGAGVVAALVTALAWRETVRPPAAHQVERLRRGGRLAAAGVAVVGLVAALAIAGNPADRLDRGWDSFKGGYAESSEGSRLASGLGSNRYDFYRVALDEFRDAPLAGGGVESFRHAYLRDGRSIETPRYPHSLQLRVLGEFGIVGALLLLVALGGALWAAALVLRGGGRLDRSVVAAALGVTTYWLVHGSADWFWEFAGLGAPAFAMLGLVCSLAPRADPPRSALLRARAPEELVVLVLVLGALSLTVLAPWTAQREIDRAAAVFATRPLESYTRLDRARTLDPLSDRASLLEGSIALRYGDLDRARRAFRDALDRVPDGQYATLQLGAIASVRGERGQALELLRRAVALAPRDPLARESLTIVQDGGTIDIAGLTRAILQGAEALS
jgi:tetratricopeptide (TPR) repeat protein